MIKLLDHLFYVNIKFAHRGTRLTKMRAFHFSLFLNVTSILFLLNRILTRQDIYNLNSDFLLFAIGWLFSVLMSVIYYRRHDKIMRDHASSDTKDQLFYLITYWISSVLFFLIVV